MCLLVVVNNKRIHRNGVHQCMCVSVVVHTEVIHILSLGSGLGPPVGLWVLRESRQFLDS